MNFSLYQMNQADLQGFERDSALEDVALYQPWNLKVGIRFVQAPSNLCVLGVGGILT